MLSRIVVAACLLASSAAAVEPQLRFVARGADGKLSYSATTRGDQIPDFSHAGFRGGESIPLATVKAVVAPQAGDDGLRIQAAIDAVAKLPTDELGMRGAVLLAEGRHDIADGLQLRSGVVLRGQSNKTVLLATGQNRRAVIRAVGEPITEAGTATHEIATEYVPCGVSEVQLTTAAGLAVGDTIFVEHPSTKEWISALGMDRFPSRDKGSYLDWRPRTLDLRWDRVITSIDKHTIKLDAPLTAALNRSLANCQVRKYHWPGRLKMAGVERLQIISDFDRTNLHDEDHAWTGVVIENAEDIWLRQISFAHLAGSAVAIWESAKRITVADCDSVQPISENGGHRRMTYHTAGQQTLFLRCRAEDGRCDFTTGHLACGPNAFVHCTASRAQAPSGSAGSWATGTLFDNVNIDGSGLELTNRETADQGVGWAAANSLLWQCTAPIITCRAPPTAQNWAIGVWGEFVGDGHWRELNEFVTPDSLYVQQLRDRRGAHADKVLEFAAIPTEIPNRHKLIDVESPPATAEPKQRQPLELQNGWLTSGNELLVGKRVAPVWWRGHTLPSRAAEYGIGVTRFVPGREGAGYTDNLNQLASQLAEQGVVAVDHHWGLWYDRRRDDHQMLRRMNGDAWAPFYEQPWARSGQGQAWDGLSKYDLTRFNPWYFARLQEFARDAQQNGIVLVQQMYFQHNVLEAGAHWADFPWRPANCLQATGFPEPPEYVGKKRVFMAEAFYDVSHPIRRELHERYIRHCLDTLGGEPNIVFQLGEEFTGPLPFVEFWIDTVAQWCVEQDRRVLVGLSCTKDVQDAILSDPNRAKWISVIDLKYWWYTSTGDTYDPPGGANLAPRQQLREWKGPKSRSAASIARAVREYRLRFPEKAVTVSHADADGWAVLAAGGSLANLPAKADRKLRQSLAKMKPLSADDTQFVLADPGREYFGWLANRGSFSLDLSAAPREFHLRWIDPATGTASATAERIHGGRKVMLSAPTASSVFWLTATDRPLETKSGP